jgi:hypothetical protein
MPHPCLIESKDMIDVIFIEMADATVKDSIVASVIEKFKSRSEVGIAKYGTTLDRTDLGILDWIQHAQEELMDGILYLEKLKKTLTENLNSVSESK